MESSHPVRPPRVNTCLRSRFAALICHFWYTDRTPRHRRTTGCRTRPGVCAAPRDRGVPTVDAPFRLPLTRCVRGAIGLLLCILAEHLVRNPFLLVGHRVVKCFKSRYELLQVLCVRLCHLLVRLHIRHCVHRLELLHALDHDLIHVTRILVHYFRELIPLR